MDFISLKNCKDRFLYKIRSRNLSLGVFNIATSGFIGIREKFRDLYLFEEYHYDTGAPHGTVHPLEKLELLPEDIVLNEFLGTVDYRTRRPVKFDKPKSQGGRGWYFTDTNEDAGRVDPVGVSNKKLFNWLEEKEEEYKSIID